MHFNLTSEQQQKFLANTRLVYWYIKRYTVAPSEYDDLVQLGMIGLAKAVATFDQTMGTKFATYAARCIDNEIKMDYRRKRKQLQEVSLNDIINTDFDGEELSLENVLYDKNNLNFAEDIEETIETRRLIEDSINIILNEFPPTQTIIYLLGIGGMSQSNIGELLNLSQSYISRIQKKVSDKLKAYLRFGKPFEGGKYCVSVEGAQFKILLSTTEIDRFHQSLGNYLTREAGKGFQSFKIVSSENQVIIWLPAEEESFEFIGQLLYEIENFNLQYINNDLPEEDSKEKELDETEKAGTKVMKKEPVSQKIAKKSKEETRAKEIGEIVKAVLEVLEGNGVIKKDNLKKPETPIQRTTSPQKTKQGKVSSTEVQAYIKTLKEFSVSELIHGQYDAECEMAVRNAIYNMLKKGLIRHGERRGHYIVNS